MIKAEYIHERFTAANDKAGFHKSMKMFFRYACKYGLIENDISLWIPSVPRCKPVPSVYTVEEIKKELEVYGVADLADWDKAPEMLQAEKEVIH